MHHCITVIACIKRGPITRTWPPFQGSSSLPWFSSDSGWHQRFALMLASAWCRYSKVKCQRSQSQPRTFASSPARETASEFRAPSPSSPFILPFYGSISCRPNSQLIPYFRRSQQTVSLASLKKAGQMHLFYSPLVFLFSFLK
jgi:hypothetical protein